VETGPAADHQPRCAVRAGEGVGLARQGLGAEGQLGAAPGGRARPDGRRQDEAVRALRAVLRPSSERPRRARALG
jgi:hypothetical protein